MGNKIDDIMHTDFEPMELDTFETRTRAFVKIQDGCNNFCSYCIIPYSRGNIRSKEKDDVVSEIKCLVKNEYKEVVLSELLDIISSAIGSFTNPTKLFNVYESVKHIKINRITISNYLDCQIMIIYFVEMEATKHLQR